MILADHSARQACSDLLASPQGTCSTLLMGDAQTAQGKRKRTCNDTAATGREERLCVDTESVEAGKLPCNNNEGEDREKRPCNYTDPGVTEDTQYSRIGCSHDLLRSGFCSETEAAFH